MLQKGLPERDEHQAERERCARDPVYWLNTYGTTYDPRLPDPYIRFTLFPRQAEFLHWLGEREARKEDGLAEKSRDVGFTWLCCAYQLHAWLFRPGFKGAFGSRKLELVDKIGDPDSIFEKIRMLLRRLPDWMIPTGFSWDQHDNCAKLINPANGASLTGEGGDQIGRGGRASLYILDEAAFLEHPQKIEAALSQTSNCKIWVSTPNGPGNPFYKKRFSGSVPVFTFHWRDDPRKDDAWYARQKVLIDDPVIVAQEIDIDYTASLEGVTIPASWVRAAVDLELRHEDGRPYASAGRVIAGYDVAEEGKDKNVLLTRQGPRVLSIESWGQLNTTESTWKVREACQRRHVAVLHYDCVGIGAGIRGTLESSEVPLGFVPVGVNGGESPTEDTWPDGRTSKERFLNLRAESWWKLRRRFERAFEWVTQGVCHPPEEMISIPNHPALIADLSLPLYVRLDTGKVKLESKKDMRKRGVKSPDFGDALAYAFIETEPPASALIEPDDDWYHQERSVDPWA